MNTNKGGRKVAPKKSAKKPAKKAPAKRTSKSAAWVS